MQLKPLSTILSLLRVLSISGGLFATSTYAQQIDKTAPPETLVRVVDLEIHTHTLSDNEISNIGRFIMGTFVGRTPKTIMGYSDKASYYDVRLDVYVLKTPKLYSVFVQVFNKWALHNKLLSAGLSEEQSKPLLEGADAIVGQDNTWVISADSVSHIKEDLSIIIDNIVTTIMPDIPGSVRLQKSAKQNPSQ